MRLFFCKVTDWNGTPLGREGQAIAWQTLPVEVAPLLPAAILVLEWLEEEERE
ncbi:Mutator mutT protein (7,8-dihydro-8-oxoguanine-triphosphatase) [Candidatus Paraburkholderia kirkii]|nr:Mutator mutT protein (7,8-dihydro-8-oxoguanine-triphosphatase) [Candidatus Paraburkholderia kirkii]